MTLGPDVMVRAGRPTAGSCSYDTRQPFFRNYRARTLAIDGGMLEMFPTGRSIIWRRVPARSR
jgi:hypothetical protein